MLLVGSESSLRLPNADALADVDELLISSPPVVVVVLVDDNDISSEFETGLFSLAGANSFSASYRITEIQIMESFTYPVNSSII